MRTTIIELEIHINISNIFSNFYENSEIFKFRTTHPIAKVSITEYVPTNFLHICKRNDMKVSYRFRYNLRRKSTLHYTRTWNVQHTCVLHVIRLKMKFSKKKLFPSALASCHFSNSHEYVLSRAFYLPNILKLSLISWCEYFI